MRGISDSLGCPWVQHLWQHPVTSLSRKITPELEEFGSKELTVVKGSYQGGGDPRLYVCQAPNAFICVSSSVSILGPFWVHLWVHFGSILGPFWVHFGSILGPFWGPFWVHFGSIMGPFCLLSEW